VQNFVQSNLMLVLYFERLFEVVRILLYNIVAIQDKLNNFKFVVKILILCIPLVIFRNNLKTCNC